MEFLKTGLTFAALAIYITPVYGQQLPLFTQYREHMSYINPASVSYDFYLFDRQFTAGVSYRSQWSQIEDAPVTQMLHASYIFENTGGSISMLGGVNLINDVAGPLGLSGAYARTAAIISGDPYYGFISIGIAGGMVQYRIDLDDIQADDPTELFEKDLSGQLSYDVSVGIYAQTRFSEYHTLYGGISIPQTFQNKIVFEEQERRFQLNRIRHFFAVAGSYFFFSEESFLQPSVWLRTLLNGDLSADFNLRYQTFDRLWIGGGYSLSNSIHAEVGFVFGLEPGDPSFRIGYSFDTGPGEFGPNFGSSHEVNLGISW